MWRRPAPRAGPWAFQKARDQKLVRFLGLSGHTDPEVLAEAIRRFPFDCVLMAFNAADTWHLPFKKALLPLAIEKEMGIIGVDNLSQLEENVRIAGAFLPFHASQLEALEQ